jgi:L-ascorbate metabolism protein UlaG (beta-lactamase superfamily)
MLITHLGHSAVLVETDNARILIDPGNLSDAWHRLTELDAVLITHQHPDHLDPQQLPSLLTANPGARVFAEPSVLEQVTAGDLPSLGDAAEALPADS